MARFIRNIVLLTFSVCCCYFLGCSPTLPEDIETAYAALPDKIDFNFHVRPILADRCYPCHGPDANARKADLRLDKESEVFSLNEDSTVYPVIPYKPQESALINRVLHQDAEEMMPPIDSKLQLTAGEKAILVKWIKQGAQWKDHWSFIPPTKATLPEGY